MVWLFEMEFLITMKVLQDEIIEPTTVNGVLEIKDQLKEYID